jgi:arabinose-5-phosphate isomerase
MLVPASRVNYHAWVPPMESDRAAKTAEDHPSIAEAKRVLRVESAAILGLIDHLDDSFIRAVELIHDCTGRVVTMGLGKSGIICRKISATLASTGTPSFFLHPAEALHGDLGVIVKGDIVLAVSNSGETEELVRILPSVKRIGAQLIAITGNPSSTLARTADDHLSAAISKEACPLGLAPTASTTATLALGDALAMALLIRKGFKEENFAFLHPGGKLGKRFLRVRDLMHLGDQVPRVGPTTSMHDVIYEMSRKGFGITAVAGDDGALVGVISDGDLRRLLQDDEGILRRTAGDCMKKNPSTIAPDELASSALAVMEQNNMTSLFAVDAARQLVGIIHLHDLWGLELF